MKSLAVLISGTGTNLQAIIAAIGAGKIPARIATVIADRGCAGSQHALHNHINFQLIDRQLSDFPEQLTAAVPPVDLVVLAGFLSLVSTALVARFPKRIINLHPSLLPLFKGAHAIKESFDSDMKVGGVSVHWVSEELDGGKIIAQRAFKKSAGMSFETYEAKIHEIEHELLPQVIVEILCQS